MLEGLHPNRPTHVLRLVTDERSARAMTDLLGEVFDPAETAVAAFEAADGRTWLLEAYFGLQPDEAAVIDLIRPIVGAAADAATFERLNETDWVKASLEGLNPVRAGRFLVHGSHDRAAVRANDWAIEIEAALAFGTGHHGTTQGCLLALTEVLRRRRPRHVLDVGDRHRGAGLCGRQGREAAGGGRRHRSGRRYGRAPQRAAERRRAELSRLCGPRRAARPCAGRMFDLILANILARPLRRLAPSLARSLAHGGTMILSGLLPRDVPGILTAYAAQDLRLKRRRDVDGWVVLIMTRGGAAPRRGPGVVTPSR
jgi:ribosomal protein L11 methyltransferase